MISIGATNSGLYAPLCGDSAAQQGKPTGRRTRCQPLLPAARVGDYAGRVSNFYSASQSKYSETYEPVRKTAMGDIWRIESRFVAGRWLHVAYSLKGLPMPGQDEPVGTSCDDRHTLVFDPEAERQFAADLLAGKPKLEFVRLSDDVTVYRSRKDQSVGIVREHVGKMRTV